MKTNFNKLKLSINHNSVQYESVLLPGQVTKFCYLENNKINYIESLDVKGDTIYPINGNSPLITHNTVLLPGEPIQYSEFNELLYSVLAFIHKYVDIDKDFEIVCAYYVILTWIYEHYNTLPYLRVIGQYSSGKTRWLQTIGSLCYHPMFMNGATSSASLFRMINDLEGTVVYDEADFEYQTDMRSTFTKIMNSGYSKGFPIHKTEGENTYSVKTYNVFGPKIVASRERFRDKALESRFIARVLTNKKPRHDIPLNLNEEFYAEASDIRSRLLMFRLKYQPVISENHTVHIKNIPMRFNQIMEPLVSLMNNIDHISSLKSVIIDHYQYVKNQESDSLESKVFNIIYTDFMQNGINTIYISDICSIINKDEIFKDSTNPKLIGACLRNKLGIDPKKGTANRSCIDIGRLKDHLESLSLQYIIQEGDIVGELP
jgi:hypothetical protein